MMALAWSVATNDGRSRVRRLNWRINGDGVRCLAGRYCGRKFDGIGRLTPETSALFTGFRHNRQARPNGQRFPSTRAGWAAFDADFRRKE